MLYFCQSSEYAYKGVEKSSYFFAEVRQDTNFFCDNNGNSFSSSNWSRLNNSEKKLTEEEGLHLLSCFNAVNSLEKESVADCVTSE